MTASVADKPDHPLTADEADERSQARARLFATRLGMLALFVTFCLILLAFLLQREQARQAEFTQRMCEQRQINTLHTNATWDELADIERRNTFIDEDIRQSRLTVYRNAKLVVPVCGT